MSTHELKCWPEFFGPLNSGDKTAELRLNDRNFQVGDILILREWEPTTQVYSGNECRRRVTHVMHGVGTVGAIAPLRGLSSKFVMLSLREVERHVFEDEGSGADQKIA